MNLDSVDASLLGLEAQIEKIKHSIISGVKDSGKTSDNLSDIFDAVQSITELREAIDSERIKTQSLSCAKILEKIVSISFSTFESVNKDPNCIVSAQGYMHRKMSELILPVAIACVKTVVKNYVGMGESYRVSRGLFPSPTLSFQLSSDEEGVFFRLKDDGFSIDTRIKVDFESDNYFLKIRNYMSKNGGWLSRKSLGEFGSEITIFIPNQSRRNLAKICTSNGVDFFVPDNHILASGDFDETNLVNEVFYLFDENHKISSLDASDCVGKKYISVGVADLHCILIVDEINENSYRYISLDANEWLAEESIYTKFAYSTSSEYSKIIPLMCGEAIFQLALKKVGQK
ncbi:MAG: hypothetical protein M9962_06645 [Oligoflexia bacterium]|nr:hypothetical protein [Oligoflexia bacterium]